MLKSKCHTNTALYFVLSHCHGWIENYPPEIQCCSICATSSWCVHDLEMCVLVILCPEHLAMCSLVSASKWELYANEVMQGEALGLCKYNSRPKYNSCWKCIAITADNEIIIVVMLYGQRQHT